MWIAVGLQEQAVRGLLSGKDVLAVLPTGFGKSLIFTVFALAKKFELAAYANGKVSVDWLVNDA